MGAREVRPRDVEGQAIVLRRQAQRIGPALGALGHEAVLFDQVENGDATLMLDLGGRGRQGRGVHFDG
ncbi:hypothetical protein D3C86_1577700 [compost metagenome]